MRKRALILIVLFVFITLLPGYSQPESPRVMILATGGTIASVEGPDGLRPAYKPSELIALVPQLSRFARIDSKMILNLDSTNMHPGDWIKMAKESDVAISSSKYRGVVITHGTDTMAYSSSMLSFMIQNPPIPIVFTGAMHPAGTPGGDAEQNLLQAVQFAAQGPPGVYVVFGGRIIRGCRASKFVTDRSDAFRSINAPLVGRFTRLLALGPDGGQPVINKIDWPCSKTCAVIANFKIEPRVAVVKLTPGYQPQWLLSYCDKKSIRGLVIESFGAGGIPFRKPLDLVPVLERFRREGIPVVITSQCPRGSVNLKTYQVGQKAIAAGAISGRDMTGESAVTKLMWVLGQTSDQNQIRDMMNKNLAGELSEAARKERVK